MIRVHAAAPPTSPTARSAGPPPRPTSPPARRRRPAGPGQRGLHRHARHGGRGLTPLLDEIRSACGRVAAQAQHVRIVEAAIEHYARTLPPQAPPAPDIEGASLEERAAFSLTLNAINFGSGWFPTLRKPLGPLGLPHDRGRAARPRAVDGGGAERDRDARGRGDVRAGPRARADGALHARAARARRPHHGRVLRALPRAGELRRGLGRAAGRDARDVADLAGRLALRGRAGAVLQARADRRRRPPPGRHRARPRTSTA